jgi:hypothetical protein
MPAVSKVGDMCSIISIGDRTDKAGGDQQCLQR